MVQGKNKIQFCLSFIFFILCSDSLHARFTFFRFDNKEKSNITSMPSHHSSTPLVSRNRKAERSSVPVNDSMFQPTIAPAIASSVLCFRRKYPRQKSVIKAINISSSSCRLLDRGIYHT